MMNVVELPDRINDHEKSEESYRTYKLISRLENGERIGEVFKKGQRVAYCESVDLDSSLQHLRRIVDWHIKDEINNRANSEPNLTMWHQAIWDSLPEEDRQAKDILYELSRSNGEYVSLNELTKRSTISNTAEIYYLLSNFARKMCDSIPYEPPCQGDGRDPYLALICESSPLSDSVRFSPRLRAIFRDYWHR